MMIGTRPDAERAEQPTGAARRWLSARIGPPGSGPRRAAITMIDQCFSSASNFVVGIVVARVAGPAGLGAYSVAYAAWLVLAAVHRAVVTDPMSINNDVRRPNSNERLQAGMAAEVSLGVVIALVFAAVSVPVILLGQRNVGIALLTLAPFLPFLLVQDYWRWSGFMQARPGRSLANDTLFNCVQATLLVGLILAGLRSPSVAIVAWGAGAVAGSAYGLRQFSVRVQTRGGYSIVASRWHMSKWLLASSVSGWASSQAYPLFAGPFVGSVGLGGLKAAQSLVSGPTLVLGQAAGSIGLPEASHGLEHGGWVKLQQVARWMTLWSALTVGVVATVVFLVGGKLLGWMYGSEFVRYASTARIISLAWLIAAFSGGPMLILKVTRNSRALFNIGLVTQVTLVTLIIALSSTVGVNGTAWAMVVTAAVGVTLQRRARRVVAREYATGVRPREQYR